ncbi:unnamed protein product [Oncorhynchus mykiss]|uniref:Uncharacterized protein n=1 Tax=Oncorhynchus mykiss TaxID=8022 RepID=A0A060ZE75_ONCMY|nr:unnamed protein product [Oncorhynchus mykiss]
MNIVGLRVSQVRMREQLVERNQHVARLQDALRREREKGSSLQCRCNQQGSELRRREQHSARLKERLTQLAERHRERGACKDLCLTISLTLNVPSHILSHSIFLSKCLLILNPHTILPLSFYLPIVMTSAQRERASRAFAFGL